MKSIRSAVLVVASFLVAGCASAELETESATDEGQVQEAVASEARRAPADIQKTVRASFGAIRTCYESALKRDPAMGGKLVLDFTIDADGDTIAPSFGAATTIADKQLQSCVLDVARGFEFAAADGVTKVSYPIDLSP